MPKFFVKTGIKFVIFCGRCGADLCQQSATGYTYREGQPFVEVEPCEACLDKVYVEGKEDEEGREENVCSN